MENLQLLIPEILLAVLGLLILLAELVVPEEKSELLYHAGIFAAGVTLVVAGSLPQISSAGFGTGTLWAFDPMALFLKDLILLSAALTLMFTMDYSRLNHARAGTYTALVLWCAVGMMTLVSAVDFLLLFLALELVSLSTFVLSGFERRSMASSEGAIKYFLIGAFSSAITVYGISLFYGATGTTNLMRTAVTADPLLVMGLLLAAVGFSFKASLAPFHTWVPDAYEGAPTPITTFMSVAPKIATLGALLRVFTILAPHSALDLTSVFFVLAVLTMTVGNLAALFQDNVKRLLAYSSVAQAGYIMIGFVVGDGMGREGVLLYSLVYLFMNFGAFAVAMIVAENTGSYDIRAYAGLGQRNLGLGLLMAFFLLSLAGIPPTAGFIGKFYLFGAAIKGGWVWLAVIGVLNSVVSVYYYLRIAYQMFFVEPHVREPLAPRFYLSSGLALTGLATLLIGLYPDPIIATIQNSMKYLP